MVRFALDTRRLCCPDEYPRTSACSAHDTDHWLRLLCRFQMQYDICFTPSPEELSIMIASEAPWADVVQFVPSKVHYLVVANSALLKLNKDGGELFKTY